MNFKKHLNARLRAKLFTSVFLTVFLALVPLAARATITVTHDGGGAGTGTYTTLYAAINACTTTSGTYTITVDANHDLTDISTLDVCTVGAGVTIVLQSDVSGTKRTFTRRNDHSGITVNGTLTVTDLIFDGDSIPIIPSRNLSMIENTTTGTLTMTDCTIQSATSSDYILNGIYGAGLSNSGTATLNNCIITGCLAYRGGAIYQPDETGATLTVNGGTYTKNEAHNNGGAFQIIGGTVTLNGVTISNNTADSGGGVYLYGGTLAMSGGTCAHNTATSGGGGLCLFNGSVTFSDSPSVSHNEAYNGGGISTNINLNLPAMTFDGNTATQDGAGIYAANALTATGTTFINNTATRYGGGIYLFNGSTLTDCTFGTEGNRNRADYGGAVYLSSGTLTVSGGSYSYNVAGGGGAFYFKYGTVTFSDSPSVNNNSASTGGGVYLEAGTLTVNGGTTFDGNNASTWGGGIHVEGGTLNATSAIFNNNGWASDGCAIHTRKGGTLTDCTFTGNGNALYGAGVYLNGGTLTVNGGLFDGNLATYGGAIHVETGTLSCTGTTFTNNNAGWYGGAIYTLNGATLTDCIVGTEGNPNICIAMAYGGGGVCLNGGALTVNGGTYAYNYATSGGAFYLLKGTATFSSSTSIHHNEAQSYGGGIRTHINLTLPAMTFDNNRAGFDGGGIVIMGGATLTATGTIFTNNVAQGGGGINFYNGTSGTLTDCIVGTENNGNYAGGGGGVHFKGSTLTVSGGTYAYNTATGSGGAFYLASGTVTFIDDPTVTHNSANTGGGISIVVRYNGTTPIPYDLTLNGGTYAYNTATGSGGGIYFGGAGTATFSGSPPPAIHHNQAGNGGGIYTNIDLTLPALTLHDNTATQDGAGIYVHSNGGLTATGTTFVNNAATRNGGGIYTVGKSPTTNTDITFTETVQRVEYIEVSTNSISGAPTDLAYINTGITFDGGHKTWARGQRRGGEVFLFYAYTGSGASQRAGQKLLSSKIQHAWPDKGNTTTDYTSGTDVNNGPFEVEQDASHIKLTDYNGVETELTYSGNTSATISTTWTLLRPYVSGACKGRLYEAKIWDAGDNLIGHYIPCRRENGEVGVYDAVSGTFLTNAGTAGSFTAGSDVAGTTYTATFTENVPITTPTYNVTLNSCNIGTSGNPNTAAKGGGIYIDKGGVDLNTGSSISHNTASEFGGGVFVATNAELGVSGTVTVKDNTTTRSGDPYSEYLKPTNEDDVCLQTLNDNYAAGSIGKIRVKGDITGSQIGITEQPVASGYDRSLDAAGNKMRQFTIDYGDHYTAKAISDVFFSNDNTLELMLLTHPVPGTTTGKLEVTLGGELLRAWYIAGIVDDNGLTWGSDANNGRSPDLPCRTLTGPDGVFARGYDPNTDHIFVVRAVSVAAEAAAGRLTGGKVIIRYPDGATAATFNGNTVAIVDEEGSHEVVLHRYPSGHKLKNDLADEGGATAAGEVAAGSHAGPGANTGPVFAMDDGTHEAKLYNVHMDGLSEYSKEDGMTDAQIDAVDPEHTHNPGYLKISPESALLSVEAGTKPLSLHEHCILLLNNNKDGGDNSGSSKLEKRTGGGIYCAGTLVCDTAIVIKNKCATNGGGVFVTGSGSVTMEDCVVGGGSDDQNLAADGGGLFIDGNGEVTIEENTIVTHNSASVDGGGVYINENAALQIDGSGDDGVLIQHNHATGHGGGVYKLGTLKVQGKVIITGNTADSD